MSNSLKRIFNLIFTVKPNETQSIAWRVVFVSLSIVFCSLWGFYMFNVFMLIDNLFLRIACIFAVVVFLGVFFIEFFRDFIEIKK